MSWQHGAEVVAKAMSGDATEIVESDYQRLGTDLQRSAVSCNDQAPFTKPKSEDVADEALYVLQHVSRFGMGVYSSEPDSGCEYWPVTPPERFAGPWNHTLRNPILIHSNIVSHSSPFVEGPRLMLHFRPIRSLLS